MKQNFIVAVTLLISPFLGFAQKNYPGTLSFGTRNTISMFNDDKAVGKGIGGQFRILIGPKMNSEWYFDCITSKNKPYTFRNDYHIGWSVMLYTKNNYGFDHLLQPYFITGHCFDLSKVTEQRNKLNAESRLSMATQAGVGSHINITRKLDCSVSAQYMIHFGKDIETYIDKGEVVIEKSNFTTPDGHLLFTISFNYKFFSLWNKGL